MYPRDRLRVGNNLVVCGNTAYICRCKAFSPHIGCTKYGLCFYSNVDVLLWKDGDPISSSAEKESEQIIVDDESSTTYVCLGLFSVSNEMLTIVSIFCVLVCERLFGGHTRQCTFTNEHGAKKDYRICIGVLRLKAIQCL